MASPSHPLVIRPICSALPSEGTSGAGSSHGPAKSDYNVDELDRRDEAQSSFTGLRSPISRNKPYAPSYQPTSDRSLQEAESVRHGKGKSLTCRPIPEQYEGGVTVEDYEGFEERDEEGDDEEEVEMVDEEEMEAEEEEAVDEAELGVEEDRTSEEVDQAAEGRNADEDEDEEEKTSADSAGVMVEGLYLSASELRALRNRIERVSGATPDPIYFYQSKNWPSYVRRLDHKWMVSPFTIKWARADERICFQLRMRLGYM